MWVDTREWYWRKSGQSWQYLADDLTWRYGQPRGPLRKTDDPPSAPAPPVDSTPVVETGKYEIIRGPEGPLGPDGPAGTSLWVQGDVAAYADLPDDLDASDKGKSWVVLDDGRLYEWNGQSFPSEGAGVTWRGPAGPPGTTGWSAITGRPSTFPPDPHTHPLTDVLGLSTALTGKEPTITAGTTAQYWRGDKSWQTLNKAAVGLGNADNTADADKPVSTATQTALNARQPLDSDLSAIAALLASDNDVLQRKAGSWAARTPAQLKADLSLTKADVGLAEADDTADVDKPVSAATQTALNAKEDSANRGAPNGYCPLDGNSQVPAVNLPSYVDDILEFASLAAFPSPGASGVIYVARNTGRTYRWSGSAYTQIIASPGTTDDVVEGVNNLYFTTARAAAAAPVQSVAGKTGAVSVTKVDVGLGNVNNTSDATKPISTATQIALDAKADLSDPRLTDERTPLDGSVTGPKLADNAVTSAKMADDAVGIAELSAGGTPSSSTWLRGDNSWAQVSWTQLSDRPAEFPVAAHTHPLDDVTGLQSALDAKYEVPGGGIPATDMTESVQTSLALANTALQDVPSGSVGTGELSASGTPSSSAFLRGDNSWAAVTKANVGLGNVDNTSDTAKPVSTATQTALDGKAAAVHTHNISDVTGLTSALSVHSGDITAIQSTLNAKADLVGGVVPTSQLPAVAFTDTYTVADQAAMLALTGVQPGDLAVRADGAGTFILTGTNPAVLANWVLLDSPRDTVTSVNGQVGTVVLGRADIGLGNVDNTSDADKNSAAVTLSNKTLDSSCSIAARDSTFTIQDDADSTRKVAFQVSGVSTGTTRILTVPNSDGTLYVSGGTDVAVADGGTGRSTNTTAYGIIAAGTTATDAMQTISPGSAGQFLKSAGASALGSFAAITTADVTGLDTALTGKEPTIAGGTTAQYWRGDKSWQTLDKAAVGLGNVDNTSDAAKNAAVAELTNKTITSAKVNQFYDTNANLILALWPGHASAVNHRVMKNREAGAAPSFEVAGADTDIGIGITPKGSGQVTLWSASDAPTLNGLGPGGNAHFNLVTGGTGRLRHNGTNIPTVDSADALTNKTLSLSSTTLSGTAAQFNAALTDADFYTSGGTDVAVADGGTGVSSLTGIVKGNGTSAFSAAAAGTDYVAPGGALGTPSSGTLTNCSGLPVAGITASTATALGVGSIEVGHASDTTLSRSAAGVLAVEGEVVPTISSTNTLTNKRITKRVNVVNAPGATPTLAWDSYDFIFLTGINAAITSLTSGITGTPTQGQPWMLRLKDDGTGRAITWGASYRAIGVTLPTTTTSGKTIYVGGFYNATDSLYDVVAVGTEA